MYKLPSLNGLRGISIIIVILFHLIHFNIPLEHQELLNRIPIFNGRFGVNIFFIISGFLITSLLMHEEEVFKKISVRNFYIRRTLRIFPAYFFLLFIYFLLQLFGYIHIPGREWLTALTYTKYLNMQEYYTSHTWSLAVEENFYLFWPVIFLMGDRVRKNVVFGLILIVPIIRSITFGSSASWWSEQSFFTRIDAIAMGCFFAFYRNDILAKVNIRWNKMIYASIALLFLLPWLSLLAGTSYLSYIFIAFGVLTGTIANILIACIIMYSVYGPRNNWYKLLNSKVLNYIGILSYSLYLWQQLFIGKRSWWVTHFPQSLIFIFLSALFSYYIIEQPFLRLKSRASKNEKSQFPIQKQQDRSTDNPIISDPPFASSNI